MSSRREVKRTFDRSEHCSFRPSTSTNLSNRMDEPASTSHSKKRTDKNADDINSKFARLSHRHSEERKGLSKGRSSSVSTTSESSGIQRRSQSDDRKKKPNNDKHHFTTLEQEHVTNSTRNRVRSRSPRSRQKPHNEKIPYFADAVREADRVLQKYGDSSRSRRRSLSGGRKHQSRTRGYSRERELSQRHSHNRDRRRSRSRDRRRSYSRERRRSSSRDRYRSSRRRSRSSHRYDEHMHEHGPIIQYVPVQYPYPGPFLPGPLPPRMPPPMMMRPPYPPIPYYLPPMHHPMHRFNNRPFRPRYY